MVKHVEKRQVSNRKRTLNARTISIYFNMEDRLLFDFIESYSKQHHIAKGKVVIEMLKTLGFMCAFTDYWTRTTQKKKEFLKLFSQS